MDADRIRQVALQMPHVVETMQWGANLVFWVGDKTIGGKMFALSNLDGDGRAVLAYCAGPERYAELLELEGVIPAPYLARAHWVAVERWDVFRASEWKNELAAAHAIVAAKLPKRTRDVLAMPLREQRRLVAESKARLAGRSVTKR